MIHLYRLFELDRAIGEGVFFPRWFPLSAYGYGLPVLNYYPPLVYYLAELLHLLGAGYIGAIKLTIATSFILAAFSMFVFARAWMSHSAAFVAALAYAYSPYLLSDAYVRGNFPEMLAMSLLPLPLALLSFVLRPPSSVLRLSSFGIILAAIILSHHLTAMQFAALLVVYAVFVFVIGDWAVSDQPSAVSGQRSAVVGLWSFVFGLALALALAAFYWVPALAELNLVYVESAALARFLVNRLIHPADFFTPALAYTYIPQSDALKRAFGFPQTILALLAGVVALIHVLRHTQHVSRFTFHVWGARFKVQDSRRMPHAPLSLARALHVLFFSLLVAFSIFMTLTPSAPLWYAIPPLRFMQFPWRFQILATIGIAFLMGVWAQWIGDALRVSLRAIFAKPSSQHNFDTALPYARWATTTVYIFFALALIALGITNLPLRDFPLNDAQVDLTRVDDSEYVVAQMGWGWTREFLPATVREFENIYAPLVKSAVPPPEAMRALPLVQIERDGLYARAVRVDTSEPFELSLKTFFFPGWQAYVDDVPARTYPRGSLGIVTVQVPAGEHRVLFRFEDTPLRLTMNVVSLLTLLSVLALWFITRRYVFIAALSVLMVLAILFAGRASASRAPVPTAVHAPLDTRVQLIGYATERVGASLRVTLHWLALAEMDRDYHSYVHLLDADGNLIAQSDGIPDQGLAPTTRWLPGEIVSDRRIMALHEGWRGEYRLRVGMYWLREEGFENLGTPIELSSGKP